MNAYTAGARRLFLALLLAMPLAYPPAVPANGRPAQTVTVLNGALIAAMRGGAEAGFEGREAILSPVINDVFDLPLIARLTLGRHGRSLSAPQWDEFQSRFSRMVIATYVSRFKAYNGERIAVLEERELKRGRRLVRTQLTERDGDRTNLDYVLQAAEDGSWRIVNVIAKGVSELSLRRAEYGSIIAREGFANLLRKLDDQYLKLSG